MATNLERLDEAHRKAMENPGTPVDIGRIVVCDFCSDDYTDSSVTGGFLFQSKATCPECATRMMPDIQKFGEERLIRERCPDGVTFADFIRGIRGGNNCVTVTPFRPEDFVPIASTVCRVCKQPFTDANTHSSAGWAETRINGTCEDCFDKMFEGMDE